MKSEFEIAKENIKLYRESFDKPNQTLMFGEVRMIIITHLASCQRFLKFLEKRKKFNSVRKIIFNETVIEQDGKVLTAKEMINFENRWLNKKQKDFQKAIKHYRDNGIK